MINIKLHHDEFLLNVAPESVTITSCEFLWHICYCCRFWTCSKWDPRFKRAEIHEHISIIDIVFDFHLAEVDVSWIKLNLYFKSVVVKVILLEGDFSSHCFTHTDMLTNVTIGNKKDTLHATQVCTTQVGPFFLFKKLQNKCIRLKEEGENKTRFIEPTEQKKKRGFFFTLSSQC